VVKLVIQAVLKAITAQILLQVQLHALLVPIDLEDITALMLYLVQPSQEDVFKMRLVKVPTKIAQMDIAA
jgi:hypothetical protein